MQPDSDSSSLNNRAIEPDERGQAVFNNRAAELAAKKSGEPIRLLVNKNEREVYWPPRNRAEDEAREQSY